MAGDGVSIQTNLVQLGNLAKTQAKSQSAAQGVGVTQELKQDDVASVQKVRETEKTEQDRVDADKERQRRREKRRNDEEDNEDEQPDGVGCLVDIKA